MGRRPAAAGRGPAGLAAGGGGGCAPSPPEYAASTPSGPNIRASCDPLAARQPITAAASTQVAMTANIVFWGDACTTREATGTDHSSAQATVRQGTNQRGSGGMCASPAIANGVTSSATSQPAGTVGTECAELVDGPPEPWWMRPKLIR